VTRASGHSAVGDGLVQTVDARRLHSFLEISDHFATWIKYRIDTFGFAEGKDFVTYSAVSEKGRPPIEYHLTLDMAKELAMVERNSKGKEARRCRSRRRPLLAFRAAEHQGITLRSCKVT
jgi:phage anti-repressor protein